MVEKVSGGGGQRRRGSWRLLEKAEAFALISSSFFGGGFGAKSIFRRQSDGGSFLF